MSKGLDFLRSQVANAVMQHQAFLRALEDHEAQAEDQRYRDLCARHIPRMREHQRMLESYQTQIGAAGEGGLKKAVGAALGAARGLADTAQPNDFLRLAGDIVMARQSEDIFKTFRDGGRALGLGDLARVGEIAERHHDDYVKEANRLIQQMFVERAEGAATALGTSARAGTQTDRLV